MSYTVFQPIAGDYDRLNDILSMGLHRLWKRRLVKRLTAEICSPPKQVLDVATGTGQVAAYLATQLGGATKIVALDPCQEMLDIGRNRFPNRAEWVLGTSEAIPLASDSFSGLTCAFGVRNFADRAAAFSEWERVLTPMGIAAVVEIHPVPSGLLYWPLSWYWKVFIPALGRLFGHVGAYRYLRDSAQNFIPQPTLIKELGEAGFRLLRSESLFGGGMVTLTLVQKR